MVEQVLTRQGADQVVVAGEVGCRERGDLSVARAHRRGGRPSEKGRGVRVDQGGRRQHERLGGGGRARQDHASRRGVTADELSDQGVAVVWGHARSITGGAGGALTGG